MGVSPMPTGGTPVLPMPTGGTPVLPKAGKVRGVNHADS